MPQEDVQWPSEEQKHDDNNGQQASDQHNQDSTKTISDVVPAASMGVSSTATDSASSLSSSTTSDTGTTPENPSTPAPIAGQASNQHVTNEPQKGNNMPKVKKFSPHYAVETVLVVAVVVLAVTTVIFHNDKTSLQKQVNSSSSSSSSTTVKQTQAIVDKVSKLMQLPSNETPTIVQVSNATQAKKESPFFDSAQDGDDALLYIKSGEAILYRPSTDKVIKVAPITYNAASSTSTTTPAAATTK
jgi:hypothetical protein